MGAAFVKTVNAGEHGDLRLVFDFSTMRRAEQELGQPLPSDLASGNIGFNMISAVFWAALQRDRMMTRDGTDELVTQLGVKEVTALVMEGMQRIFGVGETDPAGEAPAGNVKTPKAAK